MEQLVNVESLVEKFGRLPYANVGPGVDDALWAADFLPQVNDFLSTYPLVARDADYVDFLVNFGGASLEDPDRNLIVDILGFSAVSTRLLDMDGPVVDEDGFLLFAQCISHVIIDGALRDTIEYSFAFDVTGYRRPGVYSLFSSFSVRGGVYDWSVGGFSFWLERLTGRLEHFAGGVCVYE